MIEKTVLDYLGSKLDVPCSAEVPQQRPESFVVVDMATGSIEGHLGTAMIAVQSYAQSKYAAALLNEQVITAMLDITEQDTVSQCELDAEYPFPDTSHRSYRYQAVFNLTHYDVP